MEIKGERVILRSTSPADLADLMDMWNDGRVMQWVGFPDGLGYDREAVENWFAKIEANPTRHHYVVIGSGIGYCGEVYYAVDLDHRRVSLDIKLILEAQGQGLATDALTTLIGHVFNVEEAVNSVWTQPGRVNLAARRLYERCGLRPAPRPADVQDGESYWALTREDAKKPQVR